jgi:hypothetical protein
MSSRLPLAASSSSSRAPALTPAPPRDEHRRLSHEDVNALLPHLQRFIHSLNALVQATGDTLVTQVLKETNAAVERRHQVAASLTNLDSGIRTLMGYTHKEWAAFDTSRTDGRTLPRWPPGEPRVAPEPARPPLARPDIADNVAGTPVVAIINFIQDSVDGVQHVTRDVRNKVAVACGKWTDVENYMLQSMELALDATCARVQLARQTRDSQRDLPSTSGLSLPSGPTPGPSSARRPDTAAGSSYASVPSNATGSTVVRSDVNPSYQPTTSVTRVGLLSDERSDRCNELPPNSLR